MKAFKELYVVLGVLVLSFAACDTLGDVWQDSLAIYYAGSATNDASGYLVPESWKDTRHGGDSTSSRHGATYNNTMKASLSTVDVRKETVSCSAADSSLQNEDVIYFGQPTKLDPTYGTLVTGQALNLPLSDMIRAADTVGYTALLRFRLDAEQPRTARQYLLDMGYVWKETGLALYYVAAENKICITWGDASVTEFPGVATNEVNQSVTGVWTELALVVSSTASKGTVRIGVAQPGKAMKWAQAAGDGWAGRKLMPGEAPRLMSYQTDKWATDSKGTSPARGAVHMAAFWNRALSDNEVKEAFAAPQPMVWRFGAEGYGNEMFAGKTGGAIVARPSNVIQFPSSFAAGESAQIDFSVPDNIGGFPQVLRVVAKSGAEAARLSAVLDGTALATMEIAAGGEELLFIPGDKLAAGSHSLVLTRTDEGASAFAMDLVELGGSWRIGKDDASIDDLAGPGGSSDYYVKEGFPMTLHYTVDHTHNVIVHHDIPASLASRCRFEFTVKTRYCRTDLTTFIPLTVNSKGKTVFTVLSDRQACTAAFRSGELVGGENVFDIAQQQGYILIDYVDFKVTGVSKGMVLIVR